MKYLSLVAVMSMKEKPSTATWIATYTEKRSRQGGGKGIKGFLQFGLL